MTINPDASSYRTGSRRGGWRAGSTGPVPAKRRRTPRAEMEPSRRGAANARRVVRRPRPPPAPPRARRQLDRFSRILARDLLQSLTEAPGVRLLGLRQRLEPLGQLAKAFAPRGLGHARIHLGVLVRLARDGRLEILLGLPDRFSGRRIAHFLQEVEVTEGVPSFGVRGVLEETRDVGEPFDVRDAREVQIPPVRLRLAGEGFLEVFEALSALETCHESFSFVPRRVIGRGAGTRRSGRSIRSGDPAPRSRYAPRPGGAPPARCRPVRRRCARTPGT